ncbi:hypothetical protein ACFQY4_34530 [Catellatospora bangladeshensis]|uniref:hypothetical protein n=1 Tax=Catellatospora bangladeshensis TaxID=310355 RepID=UPI00361E3AAC
MTVGAVDLADPHTYSRHDPHAIWRRLRADDPVHWQPAEGDRPGFWVLTRYADVQAVFKDNRAFTSERGNVLATLLAGGDSAAGRMLAVTDGARHRDLRYVMLKALSPRRWTRWATRSGPTPTGWSPPRPSGAAATSPPTWPSASRSRPSATCWACPPPTTRRCCG